MNDPNLSAPFAVSWATKVTFDQFEDACAAFWEAHKEPMEKATIAVASGDKDDENLREAIRIGMRAVFGLLEREGLILPTINTTAPTQTR